MLSMFRTTFAVCLAVASHVTLTQAMSGELECLNETYHVMPNGMEMLNEDMDPNPCAGCTSFPCHPEESDGHDHSGHDHSGHGHEGQGHHDTHGTGTGADAQTDSAPQMARTISLLCCVAVVCMLIFSA
mmetsp:Transcript_129799/g.238737  ORF Transcript_129799/g.238737 Transcript_129799/m.238737 type:complete len:129 (-) Transcript_129799:56-442(-)